MQKREDSVIMMEYDIHFRLLIDFMSWGIGLF